MSTPVLDVRRRIEAVELALQDSGTVTPCVSSKLEAAGIQLAHRSIIDCLKAIAEALEYIEQHSPVR